MHERAGWQVITLAPTGAGLDALAAEGAAGMLTLRGFTAALEAGRMQLDPATVVVLDDAGRLGGREATDLLARIDASGAKLVALTGGDTQVPLEAGPVFGALEMRLGAARLGADHARAPGRAALLRDIVAGGQRGEQAVAVLVDEGVVVAGGDARRAADVVASGWMADGGADRIALTWSRAEADAVTAAIRSRLDAARPGRAAFGPGVAVPEWRFAFASTIHGAMGRSHDSVHLLASPGMTRQVLAAGIGLHREALRIVAPSSDARTGEVLERIVRRDAGARSVLDYGFGIALGAREAMRGGSVELAAEEETGIEAAIGRLAALAGIERAGGRSPLPRGVEGEVLAEVIGAAILHDGHAPEGGDRLAVERHVRALSDPAAWRALLRQAPKGLTREADALARGEAGVDGEGRLLTAARILARGALTARALGEERVAALFERGLRLYGKRAERARRTGRMDELAPARIAQAPVPDWPDPAARPQPAWKRPAARSRSLPPRRRRRLGVVDVLRRFDRSEEALIRDVLATMTGLGAHRAVRRADACRQARAEILTPPAGEARPAQAQAPVVKAVVGSPERAPSPDHDAMAGDLAVRIKEAIGAGDPVHGLDLRPRLGSLLERADRGPWGRQGGTAGQLAARVTALGGLAGEDLIVARALDRVLSGAPAPEAVQGELPLEMPAPVPAPVPVPVLSTGAPDAHRAPARAGPVDFGGMGLQLAQAISARVDMTDAVHDGADLPGYIARVLAMTEAELPEAAPRTLKALAKAYVERPPHAGLAKIVKDAVATALAEGPPMPVDRLRRERAAFIDRVTGGRVKERTDAELAGFMSGFTHVEIFALASPEAEWPPSLPAVAPEARATVAVEFDVLAANRKEKIAMERKSEGKDTAPTQARADLPK